VTASRQHFAIAAVVLTAAVAAVYANGLGNRFVFDDRSLVVENPALTRPDGLRRIFDITRDTHESYRPIRNLSHLVEKTFYDFNPVGYRATNLLLHALVCVFVYVLGTLAGLRPRASLVGALLFAVHPLHTESVTYISGRRDLLCALFYLGGLAAFLAHRRTGCPGAAAATVACYVLSCLSKEMGVTLPAAIAGAEFLLPAPGAPARRRVALHAVLWTLAAGFLAYKLVLRPASHATGYAGGSFATGMLTSARIVAHYATLIVFPHALNADYSGFPPTARLLDPAALLAAVGFAALGLATLAAAWTRRPWAAPVLWFFVTLAPVLQIVPHHDFMAEHFLYLPLVGLALGAGAAIERIAGARGRRWARVPAAVLLVAFAARTVRRNRDWKDPLTFWRTTAEDSLWPCPRAWAGLGIIRRAQGDRPGAESALRHAVSLDPGHPRAAASLAGLLRDTGRAEEAEAILLEAVRRRPASLKNRLKLAQFYFDTRRPGKTRQVIEETRRRFPDDPDVLHAAGKLHALRGEWPAAAGLYRQAIHKRQDAGFYTGLAEAEANLARYDHAARAARAALAIRPGLGRAHLVLANVLLLGPAPDPAAATAHIRAAEAAGERVPPGLRKLLETRRRTPPGKAKP
jgi:tetratricopeptide (TPR) repeat protein